MNPGASPAAPRLRLSLASRLVLLFAVGTSVLLLLLGTGLTWMLRSQLEARDREEIDGKTEVVVHLLRELGSGERIAAHAGRLADIGIGHPHLQLGLREGSHWLVRPAPEIVALMGADDDVPHMPRLRLYRSGEDLWWLRRIDHATPDQRLFAAYVGVHVSPAQQTIARVITGMLLAGVLGVAASAALGSWIARRGLAPLREAAREAERVTAQRLGKPLNVADAPAEVRGLLQSLNLMLGRLQSSFRALEDFSADIAHELRTPLNNLMLQTQVTLSRERSADEYREALHSNLQELEDLQRMVADMLFLARADRGMVPIKHEPVDLAIEAATLAEYFEPAASERGQRIEVSGSAVASCDRSMIRRALTNLLSNAVRYAPDGAPIDVALGQDTDGGATITVTNPAPAMTAAELRRLFGRFTRGEPAAADAERVADGAGLGLSIVESIMNLHGGRAEASSTANGLALRLVLPSGPPP